MDASDAIELADLRALADGVSTDDPHVQRFAASTLGYIEALRALVIDQAESISRLEATLERIHALRDLAHWSAESTGADPADSVVKVSDLTRALHPAD